MATYNKFTWKPSNQYDDALRHFFPTAIVGSVEKENTPHVDYVISMIDKEFEVECKKTIGPLWIFEVGEIDYCWLPSAWSSWSGRLLHDYGEGCSDEKVKEFFAMAEKQKSFYNYRSGLLSAKLSPGHLTLQFNKEEGKYFLLQTSKLQSLWAEATPVRYTFTRNNRGRKGDEKDYATVCACFDSQTLKSREVVIAEVDFFKLKGLE